MLSAKLLEKLNAIGDEEMSKVFVSYSREDEGFVKEFYRWLAREGVDCFFDKESIAWGADRVVDLEKGLVECEVVVLLLSPDFWYTEWPRIEFTLELVGDAAHISQKMQLLLLEACEEHHSRFLRNNPYLDVSTDDKFEEAHPRICDALGVSMTEKDQTVDRGSLPPVRKLPERHRMPYRSLGDRFAGRISALWGVHDILQHHKTAVVDGVGFDKGTSGIGKTQLAIEYVHRFGADYPGGVFWIDAEQGLSELVIQVAQGADIKIDSTRTEIGQLDQMWRILGGLGPVLVVLDNFPEGETLQSWLPPSGSIHVLVTTRRRDLSHPRLCLDVMTMAEALELLESVERGYGLEAEKLIYTLGRLPLALALARNVLNRRPALTIDGLLQEIKKAEEIQTLRIFAEKYAGELPMGCSKQVAAMFKISWELAPSAAKTVLQLISFLAPVPVPKRLLQKILGIPEEAACEDPLEEAIYELENRLSLLELDEDNDPLAHRLISAFVRETADAPEKCLENVCSAVVAEMARVTDECDILSYEQLEKILPHAELLLSSEAIQTKQAIDLANYLCKQYWKQRRFRRAEKYGKKAVDISEKHFEPGHPVIATSQSNLGEVLRNLGELKEARDLLQKALESDEKSFVPGHPVIAIRQSVLALVLQDLGALDEACDLLRKALESDQKSFEPGHPKIAIRQSNLAVVLYNLGAFEESRDLAERAYRSLMDKLGPQNPLTKMAKKTWEIF